MASTPNKRWFHPKVNGLRAKNLLMERGVNGSFLVRPSGDSIGKANPELTLSVRRKDEVTHIRIRRHYEGFYDLYGGEHFAALSDLIQYYMQNEGQLKEKSGEIIELRYPLNCEDPTTERWFHGKMSGSVAAQKLKSWKSGTYLVRESQQNPGTYCLSIKTDDTFTHVKINQTNERFDLGGGRSFGSLIELLEYYKTNPIIDSSQKVVHLKQPLLITTFHAELISTRVADLKRQNRGDTCTQFQNGFWEEFNSIQQQEFTHLYTRKEGQRRENKDKNSFMNIIPFDYTRVKLQSPNTAPGADYINANWILVEDDRLKMNKIGGAEDNDEAISGLSEDEKACKEYHRLHTLYSSNKQYIATQGCLQATTSDFWQMIWQEDVQIIALMHKEFQYTTKMSRVRYAKYWPNIGNAETYGNFTVSTKIEEGNEDSDYIFRELHVKRNDIAVENLTHEDELEKIVYHYHFQSWPEHGVPSNPDRLLNFLYAVDKRHRLLSQVPLALLPSLTTTSLTSSDNNMSEEIYQPPRTRSSDHFPPIVVQCHSGIGRTGTLIVIDMIIDHIKRKGFDCDIDIQRTVQSVRNQRSGLIQTEAQYTFIYDALNHHMHTIQVRLDAEMKSPREYTNIKLGGKYWRAYGFQPSTYSSTNNTTSNRFRFPSMNSSLQIDSSPLNRQSSMDAPPILPKKEDFYSGNSRRRRQTTDK